MNWSEQRIAFIGTGQMATALAAGFVRELLKPEQISGYDPIEASRTAFATKIGAGVNLFDSPTEAVKNATIVILAVKPQVMSDALKPLSDSLKTQTKTAPIVVSIAAGIPISRLEGALPIGTRVIRVMPNTPCLVGESASGFASSPSATADDASLVAKLFSSVGQAIAVSEHLLNAVTGLSGSGPAYVYVMIEALADGGVRMGLPRDVALKLAAQTVLGSAKMVLETGLHPGVLKDAVASPGGTTIAGLHAIERGGLRGVLMDAVEAATQRADELGR